MDTHETLGIRMAADVAATRPPARPRIRRTLGIAAPILIVSMCFLFGTAAPAQNGGYMRALTSHGQVAGESTDPKFNGWILLREATMPSASQIAAMAEESSSGSGTGAAAGGEKAVHKPVTIVKDRDRSSLALLAAFTSHQQFPEIDIVVTSPGGEPTARYKLTDATIVSVRAGDTDGGTHEPFEQVRISYTKIEIQQ
jgi:type VI secretion system Hcp family effector